MLGRISAIFYVILYSTAMVLPRNLPKDQFFSHQSNVFKRIVHELLYYSGSLEPIANFFLLVPVFFVLLSFFGRTKPIIASIACVAISAIAELLQIFIPGRVASIKDFMLNSLGVMLTLLLYRMQFLKDLQISHKFFY